MALARTNMTLPEELLRQVDELAGPRGRSRYVTEAVEARVKRDRLRRAVELSAGSVPTWKRLSREDVTRLIDEMRAEETD